MDMTTDLDRVVRDFMQDFRLTVTYQSTTSTYSDLTGLTTETVVSIPCQAILLEIDPRKLSGDTTRDNTLIRQGDKLLFLRPPEKTDPYRLPLVIRPESDTILIGNVQYSVVAVKATNPTATNCILYELYIRN